MASRIGSAYVDIKAPITGLKADLKKARKRVAASVDKMRKKLNSVSFKKAGMAIAAGAAVAGVAIYATIKAISALTRAAGVQEKAEAKLAAVIRATGGAAGYTLTQMKKMASGMQNLTTVGDETILNGMAILATFKNVREEGFERATQAALDMANVLDTDMKSATIMIGKALNDPIANLSAMTRAGVQFTEQQKDMIKTMWHAGNQAGAQNIILKELESQMGGAAAAAAAKFSGRQQQAANSLGDVKEKLGGVITDNIFFVELMKKVTGVFDEWNEYLVENKDRLQAVAKDGVLWLADSIVTVLNVMKAFHKGWLYLRLAANVFLEGIVFVVEGVVKGFSYMGEGYVKLRGLFGKKVENPFEGMLSTMSDIRAGITDTSQNISDSINNIGGAYDVVIEKTKSFREEIAKIPTGTLATGDDSASIKMAAAAEAAKTAIAEEAAAARLEILSGFKEKHYAMLESMTEAEREQRLALINIEETYNALKEEIGLEKDEARKEKLLTELDELRTYEDDKFAMQDEFNSMYDDSQLNKYEKEKQRVDDLYKKYKDAGVKEVKLNKWKSEQDKKIEKEKLQAKIKMATEYTDASLALLNHLAQTGLMNEKTLFRMNQAFSIAKGVMNTYEGATKALASAPPPLNVALAAMVIATGLAQVASIASQKPKGFAHGGVFAGGQVISEPTLFNIGEMAETQPEAILPLKRIGGKLGVVAETSQGKGDIIINFVVEGNLITDEDQLNDFVEQIGDKLYEQEQMGY